MNIPRKRSLTPYVYFFSVAMGCLVISESQASCAITGGRTLPLTPLTQWVSNGPWTIDPDVPVGTVLANLALRTTWANSPEYVVCTGVIGRYVDRHPGTPLGNATYSTNIAGIGMHFPAIPGHYTSTWVYFYNGIRTDQIQLVKTGTITASGNVTLTGLGYSFFAPDHGSVAIVSGNLANVPLQINPRRTCNLANTAPSVNFGEVPIQATNGLLVERSFNVSVQCSGGTSGSTPVRITFTDASAPANYTTNLSITPANSGMTVNLFFGATTITFGPASSSAGNPGQILLGNVGNGSHQFSITARLVRVGPMRPLPSFSAKSTMTMRYE